MSAINGRASRSRDLGRGGPSCDLQCPPGKRGDAGATMSLESGLGRLVGRVEELAELRGLLEGGRRLLTLTGAPGVGKTRLSRELADRDGRFAVFVDLAPLGDPALVARALAFELSVQEIPGQGLLETVIAHLSRRGRLLVVFDNCEHLIGALRELVDALLAGAPELLIVATSRERLGVGSETVWQVPPLAVPVVGGAAESPAALLSYPAVRLFVERASAVQPAFSLNSYVASAVAEVCRRLDGIPLAIELAATQVDMLTPAEIAARLNDRFDLLIDGSPSTLPRHQTLEAALDWSYELLSPAERALLRRLSVFVGGFELELAEAVWAEGDASEVEELLAGLVSRSLVAVDERSTSHARYRLLETIRAYASDRLEQAGEAAVLRQAHAGVYLALAEQAEPKLTGPDQERWLERLQSERDNLRAAVEWSLGHGRSEWALRLAGALVLFWRVRCHFSEGKELLEAALSASDAEAPALRAKALWGAGFLTFMAGDPHGAAPLLEQSLSGFREQGEVQGCARALLILGNCKQYFPAASVLPLLEESAALAREAADGWCLAHALAIAGFENVGRRGDFPAAHGLFEECVSVARQGDDQQGLRIGLIGLGLVSHHQGEYRSAQTLLEEALAIACQLDEDYNKAQALQYLGWLALGRGDYVRAHELLAQALEFIPEDAPHGAAVRTLLLLGRVTHAAGDRSGARRRFEEAQARAGTATLHIALQWMADLAIDEGDVEEGRRLLDEARAHARACGQKDLMAQALHALGRVARGAGDARQAAALHNEALELQRQIGAAPAIVASIEALAGLAGAAGRHHHAAALLGAASTHRQGNCYARVPWEAPGYESDLDHIRQSMSSEELETALAQGAALTIEEAAALACKGCGRLAGPASGWSSLTDRERQVAELVADGLTNPEIAERLVIGLATVKDHLLHVFSKLDVTRRGELAREIWRRNGSASRRNGD